MLLRSRITTTAGRPSIFSPCSDCRRAASLDLRIPNVRAYHNSGRRSSAWAAAVSVAPDTAVIAATLTGCPTALLLAAIQAALLLAAALLAATAVWPLTATLATILVALAAFGAASIWPR